MLKVPEYMPIGLLWTVPTIRVAPTFTALAPLAGIVVLPCWGGSEIQLVTVIVPDVERFVSVEGTLGSCIETTALGSPLTEKLPALCIPPTTLTVPVEEVIP
jgi:hypothetical protein